MLEAVESVLEEELSEALCTDRYERSDTRRGFFNGLLADTPQRLVDWLDANVMPSSSGNW